MRLLILDDDDLILTTYASLLRDLDFDVDTASRADDALAKMSAQKYDVVLSDIQMPGMSGVEFLKAVRQIDLDVPVILMTGGPTVESAIEALEFGSAEGAPDGEGLPAPADAGKGKLRLRVIEEA